MLEGFSRPLFAILLFCSLPLASAQTLAPAAGLTAQPTVANAGGKRCSLGPPKAVAKLDSKRLYAMAIYGDPKGALLAWSETLDQVQIMPLSPTGEQQGEVQHIKIAAARRLFKIRRWDEQSYVLFTNGNCEPAIRDHKCLVAQLLDKTGAPLGNSVRFDTNERISIGGIEQVGQTLYILYHALYLEPRLITLERDAQGALRFQDQEKHGFSLCIPKDLAIYDDLSYSRLAVTEKSWYIFRAMIRSESMGPNSEIEDLGPALCTPKKVTLIKGLPSGIALSGFQHQDGELIGLFVPHFDSSEEEAASSKRHQRLLIRLDTQGKLKAPPKSVRPEQAIPPPFDALDTVQWSLECWEKPKGSCSLRRNNTSEKAYDETSFGPLSPGSNDGPLASGSWMGDRFLVATASYERKAWQLVVRTVQCMP